MNKKGIFLILLAVACYGLSPIISKYAYGGGCNVATLLGLRYAVSSTLLLLTCRVSGTSLRLPRTDTLRLMGVVSLGGVVYCSLYYSSLRLIPAGTASLLMYTYPAFVLVFSHFLLHESMDAPKCIALLLALLGCAVVAGAPGQALHPFGVVLAFTSAIFYASYIVGTSLYAPHLSPKVITFYIGATAAPVYLIFTAATGTLTLPLPPLTLLAVAASGIVSSMLGSNFFFAGLPRVGAFRASLLRTIEPVYTAVLAAILFREKLGWLQMAGGALIISGVVLSIVARQAPSGKKTAEKAA